jgi:hypothetical protein
VLGTMATVTAAVRQLLLQVRLLLPLRSLLPMVLGVGRKTAALAVGRSGMPPRAAGATHGAEVPPNRCGDKVTVGSNAHLPMPEATLPMACLGTAAPAPATASTAGTHQLGNRPVLCYNGLRGSWQCRQSRCCLDLSMAQKPHEIH